MSAEQLLITLWRRKWIVLLTVVVATAATYIVGRELPKVYSAQSTLFVGDRSRANSDFEAIQSGQVLAKTYAELIQSKNVARRVAAFLPDDRTPGELLDETSFKPVSDTQLIVVSAEGSSPEAAARLANAYASVFERYAVAELAEETQGDVSVADRAVAPSTPIRPRPMLYAGVMLMFSLFLGAGLAILRDRFDTRLGTDEEISRLVDLPVLAHVPATRRRRATRGQEQQFLEAFRILRTNLTFLRPGEPLSTVLVTSAQALDGKSTCAVSLARVIAEQGRRVVLIEGDLRRPMLARMFGLEATRGVAHYLVLDTPFEEILHETSVPNLYVAPAAALPPSPSTVLQTEVAQRLVDEAASWGDFVVVDSPPLSAGADASILAHAVGAVLFVVNYRRTRRSDAVAAVRRLRQTEAQLAGVVINEVPRWEHYDRYYTSEGPPTEDTALEALTGTPPRG
jgi:capsular exopolysaccharide synthesis family protein